MARKISPKDLYMNFKSIPGLSGAVATDLKEYNVDTGVTIRGHIIWLVHMVQFYIDFDTTSGVTNKIKYALSTLTKLTVMPELTDKGCIAKGQSHLWHITEGGFSRDIPKTQIFLPPIPVASPKLALYVQASVDNAEVRSKNCDVRMGYTTAAAEEGAYTEVVEAWGW